MFYSIIFPTKEQYQQQSEVMPDCFQDLNLDKIILPLFKGREKYDLGHFFFTPCQDIEVITYRQYILGDLEDRETFQSFKKFADDINILVQRKQEIEAAGQENTNREPNYYLLGQFFYCVEHYCITVETLVKWDGTRKLQSEGLVNFTAAIQEYANTDEFLTMAQRARNLRSKFNKLQYCLLIKDGTIRVRDYERQENSSEKILDIFKKFRQKTAKDYRHELADMPFASHVEVEVLKLLAKVYPQVFRILTDFCHDYQEFLEDFIVAFARETQFYFAWLTLVGRVGKNGLAFCYPNMGDTAIEPYAKNFYDLALAEKIGQETVVNDFFLEKQERIIVVTGPNQGGKTTFARALGQISYLASLGLSVPGTRAQLMLPDKILTHFGKEEDISTLNGQLANDLAMLHSLLMRASAQSLIIVNEIFSSTTYQDAVLLGQEMMRQFKELGTICVVVTFISELAQTDAKTVSMVGSVSKNRPDKRTYKIMRAQASGVVYALTVAEKHGLTYEQLDRRLKHASTSNV